MRLLTLAVCAAVTVVFTAPPASADPLICVRTGEVWVGDIRYNPPDPCLL